MMDDGVPRATIETEEYQTRLAIENMILELRDTREDNTRTRQDNAQTRDEVREARGFSRHWTAAGIATVATIALFLLLGLFGSGLGAIRENTRTVELLRSSSIANKSVLESILQDREAVRLNFEILKRQLQSVEDRIPERDAAKRGKP